MNRSGGILREWERRGWKPGLERINRLLAGLGGPDGSFPSVLVAGTNGKGSTSAFIANILTEHGMRCGLYTSPHLVSPRERIRIDGEALGAEEFEDLIARVADHAGEDSSYFECMTAAAILHFAGRSCDAAVLEAGMGGRLDAVNAVEPAVSVLTGVDFDHTEYLGSTLNEIAREKAAVSRPGRPFILPCTIAGMRETIEDAAGGKGADLRWVEEPGTLRRNSRAIAMNAALAASASGALLEAMGAGLEDEPTERALEKTEIPGRCQRIGEIPGMIVDIAHNPSAMRVLRETVSPNGERFICLFSCLRDKSAGKMLGILEGFADLVITELKTPRATPLPDIPIPAGSLAIRDLGEAIESAIALAEERSLPLLVTGSSRLAGEVLAHLGREDLALASIRGSA